MPRVARAARRTISAAIAALACACLRPPVYSCDGDNACLLDDRQGRCLGGFCAYPDADCDSTLRFGPSAGDGMAGECVPTGGTSEIDPTLAASSDAMSEGDCGACDVAPDPCHLPTGACIDGACEYPPAPLGTDCKGDDDPCINAAECDGAGGCVVTDETVCMTPPPGNCYVVPGECLGPDECTYVPKGAGEACEDGDDCTLFDTCDGAGHCIPDDEQCATANLCAVGSCGATGHCSFFPVTDGTSCGALPVDVCCAGECVNLELDERNCGSCGTECGPTQTCTAMDPTPMCTR
jgi:hypothetical protein